MRRVVVTGMGLVSCLGNAAHSVSRALREGISGICHIPEYAELGLRSQVAGQPVIDLVAEIDRQLKHLGTRLKLVKVANLPANPRQVSFGCWVSYEDEEGNERCYQLVGPDEFDVAAGKISIDSPVGQALLHKKVDDEVLIRKPSGNTLVTITAIGNSKPD